MCRRTSDLWIGREKVKPFFCLYSAPFFLAVQTTFVNHKATLIFSTTTWEYFALIFFKKQEFTCDHAVLPNKINTKYKNMSIFYKQTSIILFITSYGLILKKQPDFRNLVLKHCYSAVQNFFVYDRICMYFNWKTAVA